MPPPTPQQLAAEEPKREITYSVFGQSIESTLRLLNCNKNLTLIEKSDTIRAKWFHITSTATKTEHREFFGNTKSKIYQNLECAEVIELKVKKCNFLDKIARH